MRAPASSAPRRALRESAHSPMIQAEQIEHDEWLARLRGGADGAEVDDALAAGRRLSQAEAVALAAAVD